MPSASPDSSVSTCRRSASSCSALERRLGLGDDRLVALGLAELDQLDLVGELALEPLDGGDRVVELLALAHDLLRALGRVPEVRVLGGGVQLVEAALGAIPVKDASSAGSAPAGSRRRALSISARMSKLSEMQQISGART